MVHIVSSSLDFYLPFHTSVSSFGVLLHQVYIKMKKLSAIFNSSRYYFWLVQLAFYVVMPFSFWFSSEISAKSGRWWWILKIKYLGSINEYLSLTMAFIVAFGLCFQLPVLLTLLGKVGLISSVGLANFRKYAVVAILIVAALVTPPDVITQIILFSVVYLLYEVSIFLVRRVEAETIDDQESPEQWAL